MQDSSDKPSPNSPKSSVDTHSDGEGKAIHKPSVQTDSDVKQKVMSGSHSNCDNSTSADYDEPPFPNDYSKQLEAHRVAFNQKFFGTDFKDGSPIFVPKKNSKVISGDSMDLIIDALRNYDSYPEYYKLMHKSQIYE